MKKNVFARTLTSALATTLIVGGAITMAAPSADASDRAQRGRDGHRAQQHNRSLGVHKNVRTAHRDRSRSNVSLSIGLNKHYGHSGHNHKSSYGHKKTYSSYGHNKHYHSNKSACAPKTYHGNKHYHGYHSKKSSGLSVGIHIGSHYPTKKTYGSHHKHHSHYHKPHHVKTYCAPKVTKSHVYTSYASPSYTYPKTTCTTTYKSGYGGSYYSKSCTTKPSYNSYAPSKTIIHKTYVQPKPQVVVLGSSFDNIEPAPAIDWNGPSQHDALASTPTIYAVDASDPIALPQNAISESQAAQPSQAGAIADGWALLGASDGPGALRIFSAAAVNDSRDANAKLGYGLAAAMSGDLTKGVWAIRRAVETDASALMYAPVDTAMRVRLREIRDAYGAQPQTADTLFMIATTEYMLGDAYQATMAIDQAIGLADGHTSTRALRDLIDELRTTAVR